jgi:L-Ala-D/L-Glu epimerase
MSTTAGPVPLEALLDQAPPVGEVRLREIELRKSDPTWRFALAANASSPGLLLELVADGVTGAGSAGEIRHLGHDLPAMRDQLRAAGPALRGGDRAALAGLTGPARCVVHTALVDLVARSQGVPVRDLLGPTVRESVALTRILSLKSPAEMAGIAAGHRDEGYRHVKVKLDNAEDGDLDVARLRAIRAEVGPDFGLTIDANQSYSPEQAVRLVERIADLGVLVFEQPVPAGDLDGLAWVTQRSAIPIEADEAADSVERIRVIAETGAAHGVSIKLAKLGGLDHAATAARICADAGLEVRIGAHVGSRLLNAAALQLAAVLPGLREPAELAEFARLEGDPARGLEVEDGAVRVSPEPGLGITVAPDPARSSVPSTVPPEGVRR